MINVSLRVGRLVGVVFTPPFTMKEVETLTREVRQALEASPRPMVFCCDMRSVAVLAPDVSDGLTALMKGDNPRIERNALVLGAGATAAMQFERMIREAGSPARRTFHDASEAVRWLSEKLDASERTAVEKFMTPARK